jgi:two-component system sensor histidine kinase AlgZ
MTFATPTETFPSSHAKERYLPDFRSLSTTLILSLLGEVFAFMYTFAEVSSPTWFWSELGINSLFILWIVLTSQTVLAMLADALDNMQAVKAGWCVFAIVEGTTLAITWLVYLQAGDMESAFQMRESHLPFQLLQNGLLAGLMAAVVLRYQYIQYLRRLQVRAESAARLDALQARMRPHFLFNSLNAIASLTRRNPALAEELTLDLAELFRAILRKDIQLTALQDELVLSRQYLNIEKQRLGERLRVVWSLDEDMLAALVPLLSLQPLLENAVYHGIEPCAQGGTLEISCQAYKKNQVVITVRNPMPLQQPALQRPGNRFALENVRLRLQAFFGDEAKLTVSMSEGFYQARMVFPYTTRRLYENLAGR